MTQRIRWGILGTAAIAREAVIPAMRKSPYDQRLELTAIASRSLERAQQIAKSHGIERAYGSYDALLADPEIDAVYIPLPNHLHVPLSIQAIESGKHVLCEKPLALSAHEARWLHTAAQQHPQLKVMEAFMYRCHPQWQWLRQTANSGVIGAVQTIQAFFSFFDDNPANILHHPQWGGGSLLDIGCYGVSLARFVFDAEPTRVLGSWKIDDRFGVDRMTSAIMEFEVGIATFVCATCAAPFQQVQVLGTKGRVELRAPFNPPCDERCRALLETDNDVREIEFDHCDQYGIQADLFSCAILDDTAVPISLDDSVRNAQVIDAIARSVRSGTFERP